MPLLIPIAVLLALFALALLMWPVTLWRRARRGHLRRRIAPWAVHVRAVSLGLGAAVFALLVLPDAGTALPGQAGLGLMAGCTLGMAAAALARIEFEARAVYITPRWGFPMAIALVVAARMLWLGWDVATGESWADVRRHAVPLGGLLIGYAFAQAGVLALRLRRRRRRVRLA